jgi:MFS family permease
VGERNVVIIVGPAGVGVIAGLGLLNVVGRRWPRPNAIGTGLLVAGSALLFLAAARPLTEFFSRVGSPGLGAAFPVFVALIAATAFVFGLSYALITVPSMTLLQEELPDEIRGRVFGFLNMLVSIFSLIPLVVVGPIADLWGVAPVFVGFAAIVAIVWIAGKSTREMRRGKAKLVTE